MNADELKSARARVLKLLSYRLRSRHEVETYLQRKGYCDKIRNTLIEELQRQGYIDDSRFAGEYIDHCVRRGYGPRRAWSRLRELGVDRKTIESLINCHFDPATELERAEALLEKRIRPGDNTGERRWIRRQAAFLKSRGFHDAVILRLLAGLEEADTEK